jgi:hypothetical protein
MNLLSDPNILNKLFLARSQHLRLQIGATDASSGSRIGGRAPECFAQSPVSCPNCSRPMIYYLTLAPDLLGVFIESGQALSIFYCPDFTCRLRSRWLEGPPSLVAIGHEDCSRGVSDNILDSPIEGRCIVAGQIVEDVTEYKERDQSSKIGGRPGLIQDTGAADVEKLETEGLKFIFQLNEESYPRDLKFGEYAFAYGAIYVFGRFSTERLMVDATMTAAFWQCT